MYKNYKVKELFVTTNENCLFVVCDVDDGSSET
jgi:hypothetical protein